MQTESLLQNILDFIGSDYTVYPHLEHRRQQLCQSVKEKLWEIHAANNEAAKIKEKQ